MTDRPMPKTSSEDTPSITRRHAALRLLAAVSLGGAAILIAGCGNSVAPRDYKRPPSAKFYGGKGRGH